MIRYVLGRLAVLPVTLLVVSLLTFTILRLVPGDAVDALGGDSLSDADRAKLRADFGLDRPFVVQFARWLGGVLHGDLGISLRTNRPVAEEVTARLGTTIELAVFAILLALVAGILAGAVATRWRNGWTDRLVMGASTLGMSVPNYFAATLMILAISLYMPSFGVVSYVPASENLLGNLRSLIFPAISLAIVAGATFCRYVRAATEEIVTTADFVRTARSKGASDRRILMRHVVPNALIPLVTVAGLQFGYLIGGTVVIETIFALPGIGQLLIASISQRDYPMIQGCVLLQTTNFVVINLIIDLLYPVLDPRVRTARSR